jgi:hypothetical protein
MTMSRKRYRGRRIDATGRSIGNGHHCRFHRWEVTTPAFRSLSIGARALLLELKMLYTGNNNGALFLSVREAGKRLNIGKNTAAPLFIELQETGFIRAKAKGAFNIKATRGGGAATTWVLTEFAHGNALPTKDFIHWQPTKPAPKPTTKNHSPVPLAGQPVPNSGTVPFKRRLTVPPTGTVAPFIGLHRYHQRDTDNIPREAEPLSCRATAVLPEAVAA